MPRFYRTNPRTIERRAREMEEMEREDDKRLKLLEMQRTIIYDYTKPKKEIKKITYKVKPKKIRQVQLLEPKLISFD